MHSPSRSRAPRCAVQVAASRRSTVWLRGRSGARAGCVRELGTSYGAGRPIAIAGLSRTRPAQAAHARGLTHLAITFSSLARPRTTAFGARRERRARGAHREPGMPHNASTHFMGARPPLRPPLHGCATESMGVRTPLRPLASALTCHPLSAAALCHWSQLRLRDLAPCPHATARGTALVWAHSLRRVLRLRSWG